MWILILSVSLFGFVHPGSRLIMDSGMSVTLFCFLWILLRCLFMGVAWVYKRPEWPESIWPVLGLGVLSLGVQVFEFQAIANGTHPSLVTMILFSYPMGWLFYKLCKGTVIHRIEIYQCVLTVGGLFIAMNGGDHHFHWSEIWIPGVASLLMAMWIAYSHRLKAKGWDAISMSFFSDLSSLVLFSGFLVVGRGGLEGLQWQLLSAGELPLLSLGLAALLFGVVPNVLFFNYSVRVPVYQLGLIMALEPLFSLIYSKWIWPEITHSSLFVGGLLMILSHFPEKYLNGLFSLLHKPFYSTR